MKMSCKPGFLFKFFLSVCWLIFFNWNGIVTAQPFGPQNVLSAGRTNNAGQIELVDLNSDNLPDVVTSCDLGLTWFENMGEGNFNFQATLFSRFPCCEFVFGDFNGDSSPDLLIAQPDSNLLCWCPNVGSGIFDSVIIINYDSLSPKNLVICDLDMDLDLDFLVSYSPYNRSVWYYNDGEGNFKQTELNSVPYTGKVTGTWDFDSDGDPDLLVSSSEGLTALENNGSGIFIQAHPIVDFSPGENQWTGDLDGDGDKDLVLFHGYEDELVWVENTGSLQNIITHPVGTMNSVRSLCLADFDLDEDLDIVSGTYANGLSVFENLGMGVFNKIMEDFDDSIVPAIGAGDLDQDGNPDFAVIYGQNGWLIPNQAAWFKGIGDLTFEEPKKLTSITSGPCCAVADDLNGDQEKDIIIVSSGDDKIGWFRNTGYHTYAPFELITDTLIDDDGCEFARGGVLADDLDLDGDIDLIAYSCHSFVLINDGSGTFSNAFEFGYYLREVHDICLEDLDYDGYKDIVAATYDGIVVLRNDGDGTFSTTFLIPIYWIINSVTTGDIDGDGHPDIIFIDSYSKKIGYALNDGNGGFEEVYYIIDYEPSYSFGKIRAADIDKDDDLDIIASLDYKIVWYEHENNSWGDPQIIVPPTINDYLPTDFDDDGDVDILYTKESQILWLANDGSGNFAEGKIITVEALGYSRVFTYDLDNDFDLDIISTSSAEAKVAWYDNLRLTVSVPEPKDQTELFYIYPLPAKDIVNIRCISGNIHEIHILDITGKSVFRFDHSSEINQLNINTSNLKPGIYFIKFKNDRGLQCIRKIMKI